MRYKTRKSSLYTMHNARLEKSIDEKKKKESSKQHNWIRRGTANDRKNECVWWWSFFARLHAFSECVRENAISTPLCRRFLRASCPCSSIFNQCRFRCICIYFTILVFISRQSRMSMYVCLSVSPYVCSSLFHRDCRFGGGKIQLERE